MRAGAQTLSLLSAPLSVHMLKALAEEPKSLLDLRRAVGLPAQTTARAQLTALTKMGVLERRRRADFPVAVDYELSRAGFELLKVADVLQAWLTVSPDGPLLLGSVAAKSTIKALVDGWSSAIVRALAARPLSLTELNRLISGINYPSLERRLAAMRLAGLIEVCPGPTRGTPYAVTDLLRRAIAPLAAAACWEGQHLVGGATPIGRIDVESAFLLLAPMLAMPLEVSGDCRLAVEIRRGGDPSLAGALVGVRDGRVATCVARLEGTAGAWASGAPRAWIRAVGEERTDCLELGGETEMAIALLDGMRGALLRTRQRT